MKYQMRMLKLARCKERWLNIFEVLASVVLFMMTNNCKLQGQENRIIHQRILCL